MKIEILANSNQSVHFYIEDDSNHTWVCSAIYANTNPRMREILYDELFNINPCLTMPWLVTGDFSDMIHVM